MSRFIWGTGDNSSKSRPTSRNSVKNPKSNSPENVVLTSSSSSVDLAPAPCHSCNSIKCCNNNWPIKDLPADIRPSGTLGLFTWCGLTVYVAVAGPQHEAPEITDYRQSYLNQRLQELILTLDITLGSSEESAPNRSRGSSPGVMPSADKKLSYFESVFKDVAIPNQQFTAKELSIHNTKDDLYVAVDGKVLDVTKWQDQHPGGPDILLDYGGQDATDEFRKRHEANVLKAYAPGTVIGTLVPERIKPAGPEDNEIILGLGTPADDSNSDDFDEFAPEPQPQLADTPAPENKPDIISAETPAPRKNQAAPTAAAFPGTALIPPSREHIPHSSSGVICPCDNCVAVKPPSRAPTPDLSQPANPFVAAEVTALLAQLQSLIGAQAGVTLTSMIPKLAVSYTCEEAEDDEDEGIVMEMVVKYRAKKGGKGQHPMCAQARAGLGIEGKCSGC